MTNIESMIRCDGCGTEITWAPIIVGKRHYCCRDCLEGRPCHCGERMELDEERRAGGAAPPGGEYG